MLHQEVPHESKDAEKIGILGAGGRLGAALVRAYQRDAKVLAFDRRQLDLARPDQLRETLEAVDFDTLINCAAQTNVDHCEEQPAEAFLLNAEAPGVLAEICTAKQARLIHISTDYVFDGTTSEPYTEEDEAKPISVYGESKLAGERRVLAVSEEHLVARVSWIFGPDRPSFIDWAIQQAREKDRVQAVADKISTPTYALDIAALLRPLLESGVGGVIHLANEGHCSWREYGQWALDCYRAEGMALRTQTVEGIPLSEMKQFIARRPIFTVLATKKYQRLTGHKPREWHEAVREYVHDYIAPRAQV